MTEITTTTPDCHTALRYPDEWPAQAMANELNRYGHGEGVWALAECQDCNCIHVRRGNEFLTA